MIVSHVLQPTLVKKRVCQQLHQQMTKNVPKDSIASQVLKQGGQLLNAMATTVHVQLDIIARKELKIL